MFVAIVDGVRLRPGADEGDFAQSFADANAELAQSDGFASRRLLRSDDGSFRIVVEHASRDTTFERMRQSGVHAKWHGRMASFTSQAPSPGLFLQVEV